MPTIKTTITAPTFETVITTSRLTIDLPERHMRVQIEDNGHIRVVQREYDLLDGAPGTLANQDVPRYMPPGEYEFTLPECLAVNLICDTGGIPPSSSRFPAQGSFTIPATHWHG